MKIKIICVGKIKEKFYRSAIDEYMKVLSREFGKKVKEMGLLFLYTYNIEKAIDFVNSLIVNICLQLS